MPRPNQPTKYPLLTIKEAAERLGISTVAVKNLRKQGVLKNHYQGGWGRGCFTRQSVARVALEHGYFPSIRLLMYDDLYPPKP